MKSSSQSSASTSGTLARSAGAPLITGRMSASTNSTSSVPQANRRDGNTAARLMR